MHSCDQRTRLTGPLFRWSGALRQAAAHAQVSDIAIAVREGADAVMLSGESAYGKFPFKAVDVMSTVAQRTESAMLRFSVHLPPLPGPLLPGGCDCMLQFQQTCLCSETPRLLTLVS